MHNRNAEFPARPWRLLAAYGLYVLAVLWPEPLYVSFATLKAFRWALPPGVSNMGAFFHLSALYAALPALIFFGFRFFSRARPGSKLHIAVDIALHLYLVAAILDILPTFVFLTFATGTLLSTILWTLIFIWAHHDGQGRVVKAPWFRMLTVLGLAAFTFWSASSMVRIPLQAIRLAGGHEFCIATPRHAVANARLGAIESLFDLRGTNLTASAASERAVPYAVLVSWEGDKFRGYRERKWYWSIRSQKFVPRDALPRQWPAGSHAECTPRPDFLFTL